MDNPKPVTVTIISRSRLFRNGLKSLLNGSRFSSINEMDDFHRLSDFKRSDEFGIVLLDAGHNLTQLIDDIRQLTTKVPDMPVVVLSDVLEWRHLIETISAGASGYLLTEISTDALVSSLQLVELGEKVFPTHMAALLLKGMKTIHPPKTDSVLVRGLSLREAQILRHLVEGESNKMIARRLEVTEATVKVHMKSLLRKIKCTNRTQAAVWALNHGFDETAFGLYEEQVQLPSAS